MQSIFRQAHTVRIGSLKQQTALERGVFAGSRGRDELDGPSMAEMESRALLFHESTGY